MDKPYPVFFSHATYDKWIARVLCRYIEDVGNVVTWRDDRDIDGGDRIPDAIRAAIQDCDEFLSDTLAVASRTEFSRVNQWDQTTETLGLNWRPHANLIVRPK